MNRRSAFTLIELLVVLSIIVLLIALVLPAFERSREAGISVQCGSRVHQIGLANIAYMNDNDQYFPGHHLPGARVVWPARLREYAGGGNDVFWCPKADEAFKWVSRYNTSRPAEYGYRKNEAWITSGTGFSYGYNDWGVKEFTVPHLGLGGWVDHEIYGPPRMPAIVAPGNMILIGDNTADYIWDTAIDPKDEVSAAELPGDRHFGGANIVHVDGHVENYLQEELTSTESEWRRRWNADNQPHPELSN